MNLSETKVTLTIPEIGLIALTRGILGIGIGLLISELLPKEARRATGIALAAVGALSTAPILWNVRGKMK